MKNAENIKKIDKAIYKAGIKNGLNIKDMGFVQDIIKGNTLNKSYIDNIAKPGTKQKSIDATASQKLDSPRIEKTLADVLIDSNITKKSIIDTHKDILNNSMATEQFNVARNCNRDFMELSKMLDPEAKTPTTINLTQINNYSTKELNDKLNDIING